MDEFIQCLKEASSANCGHEAGDWIHRAKQIYFAPTKTQLKCSDIRMQWFINVNLTRRLHIVVRNK